MAGLVEVGRGVAIRALVAATDMPVGEAEAQVNPPGTGCEDNPRSRSVVVRAHPQNAGTSGLYGRAAIARAPAMPASLEFGACQVAWHAVPAINTGRRHPSTQDDVTHLDYASVALYYRILDLGSNLRWR